MYTDHSATLHVPTYVSILQTGLLYEAFNGFTTVAVWNFFPDTNAVGLSYTKGYRQSNCDVLVEAMVWPISTCE